MHVAPRLGLGLSKLLSTIVFNISIIIVADSRACGYVDEALGHVYVGSALFLFLYVACFRLFAVSPSHGRCGWLCVLFVMVYVKLISGGFLIGISTVIYSCRVGFPPIYGSSVAWSIEQIFNHVQGVFHSFPQKGGVIHNFRIVIHNLREPGRAEPTGLVVCI